MAVLTIGEFARASRLSPKALRLYDELGLLIPARVDPVSGYRLYERGQLERARLVAWLRRLGMPLARIRVVCDLPPAAAAARPRRHPGGRARPVAARRPARRPLPALLGRADHGRARQQHPPGPARRRWPAAAVQELIGLANSAGGPDNIACVAAEIVETAGPGTPGDE